MGAPGRALSSMTRIRRTCRDQHGPATTHPAAAGPAA